MVKAGIIDPTMVTRSALQNAASIAKNILTTEAIVVDAFAREDVHEEVDISSVNRITLARKMIIVQTTSRNG
jgi:hypothetical protein